MRYPTLSVRELFAALSVCLCLSAVPESAGAETPHGEVGVRAGMNWSKLIQPVDPRGRLTLMHGTAFDGFGFALGGSFTGTFTTVGTVPLGAEIDVLYTRHRAVGFERNPETDAKRTAVLTADVLRIPAMLRVQFSRYAPDRGLYAAFGPELWMGLRSGATVTVENTSRPASKLVTTPVTHLTFNTAVGFDIPVGGRSAIPFELRGTWDPFVAKTTVERFRNFHSVVRPGSYEVAFNWQLLLLTGFSWEIF